MMASSTHNLQSQRVCRMAQIILSLFVIQLFTICHGNVNNLQTGEQGTTANHDTSQGEMDYSEEAEGGSSSEIDMYAPLQFHPASGNNSVVTADNLTVYTISDSDVDGFSGVVTSRPLRDNEIFEILHGDRLNGSSYDTYYFDMGFTEFSPEDLKEEGFPYRMEEIEAGEWRPNWTFPFEFTAGDRLGMARLSNGTIRLFVNDIDVGEVATGVPERVYGYVEIYGGDEIDISISATGCQTQGLERMSAPSRMLNEVRCLVESLFTIREEVEAS